MSKVEHHNTHESIVKAIMTNDKISEDERSKIISDMMDEFSHNYPNLENTATKQDLSELELKLTKDIEGIRLEIKELDIKLANTKTEIIKWVASMMFAQTALTIGAIKLFV